MARMLHYDLSVRLGESTSDQTFKNLTALLSVVRFIVVYANKILVC